MAFDAATYRRVLGHLPTGVVVVTGMDDGHPVGLAVGSFTSVSLDPPLVGFFVAHTSSTWPRIAAGGVFCANVLCDEQESVCKTFATSGVDKFAAVDWTPGPTGAPVLAGALATIDCTIESVHEAGDHVLVLGRVVELDAADAGTPLVFFKGAYARLS